MLEETGTIWAVRLDAHLRVAPTAPTAAMAPPMKTRLGGDWDDEVAAEGPPLTPRATSAPAVTPTDSAAAAVTRCDGA